LSMFQPINITHLFKKPVGIYTIVSIG